MDTSNEYIEMCKKALEVQCLRVPIWGFVKFEIGDLFTQEKSEGVCFIYASQSEEEVKVTGVTWLPRMDQLAALIENWNKDISAAFFGHIQANSKYNGIPERGFDSIEKHLLCFLMYEKFNKKWEPKYEGGQFVDKGRTFVTLGGKSYPSVTGI